MKVLIALNSAWNLLNFRSGLIKALVANGHSVVLAAPKDEHVPSLQALGVRFVDIPMRAHSTNPWSDFHLLLRFVKLLQREKPDVLLAYTAKPNVYGSLAARWVGVPVINNIAGLGTAFIKGGWLACLLKTLYRLSLSRSHRIFFQNPDDLNLFIAHKLVAINQAALLPGSGVDLQKFKPVPLPCLQRKAQQPLPTKQNFVFLMVARMLKDKGVEEFVEAARVLKASHSKTDFALLGFIDSNNPNGISASLIQSWVDERIVSYWGVSSDIRAQLALADCVVLPSYREGTPRTLLEAAAMGRPMIATDVPGCREVVKHGVNGLLCVPRSSESLAKQMKNILALPDSSLQSMSDAARQLVEAQFDEQIVIGEYCRALEDL